MSALSGRERNDYDRLVHFSVGLLIYYPVFETLPRIARCRAPWSYLIPVAMILAASALWEIAEVYYGIGFHRNPGYAGANDPFDSQNDMAIAFAGALVAMFLTAILGFFSRERPAAAIDRSPDF
jgi:putative membrane protein